MEDSIFRTIKSMLGYGTFYDPEDAFDQDIMVHINTILMVLTDLGVGKEDFTISDETATWDDFLSESNVRLDHVKSYMYLRVRQLFDPPASSALATAFDKQIEELGWRLREKADYYEKIEA